MTTKICTALLSFLAFVGNADAEPYTAYGPGTYSCGQWLSTRSDEQLRYIDLFWVLGFVSAAGFYNSHGDLETTDKDAIMSWLDNYCRANPLEKLFVASNALVVELAQRHKQGD